MEGVPAAIEVSDDRFAPPVAVAVDDVARITVRQQLRVKPLVGRPRLRMRTDADTLAQSL
jgi:hypothetical protein